MKGCLHIVRGMEKQLTLPGPSVTIKGDGTIWMQGMAVLGIASTEDKAKYMPAAKAGKWADIPDHFFTRMGDNPNGLWAGDDEAWSKHPAKIATDQAEATRKIEQAKIVTIYLSSRGWGDFSPCEWTGDITRPDAEILTECKSLLINGHDVDHSNQSDEQILNLITAARTNGRPQKSCTRSQYTAPDIVTPVRVIVLAIADIIAPIRRLNTAATSVRHSGSKIMEWRTNMILAYTDILGDRKTHRIKATVTTDHPASHYDIPVIVLEDGNALDLQSWVLLGYRVVRANKQEQEMLKRVFDNFNAMCGGIK